MPAEPQKKFISPDEYLAMEVDSAVKHEYFNGEIFQMAGASLPHFQICSNTNTSISSQLKGRDCRSGQSDLRITIPATGLFTYPDVIVFCGEPELLDETKPDTLLNPTLIVEVLSPSTAEYDRGPKFDHYKTIESLKEYVLVWQDKKRVARYTKRDDSSWVLTDFIGDEAIIELSSIDCTLLMDDIYDKVEIES